MPAQRFYIYRCGTTNAWALTGEKVDARLPAPLATDHWRLWMQISRHQIENGHFGLALETAETQIAAKGYYLFTHSMLDARAGPDTSAPVGARQHRRLPTTAVMTEAHRLCSTSFDPDTFNMLTEVLDEVWASISSGCCSDFREIEAARFRLATIVLDLAKDGQLGQLQITRTAARLMRENHMSTKQTS